MSKDSENRQPNSVKNIPPVKRSDVSLWLAIQSFIWDNDTHLKSPEERRLLFKLDCAILPCLALGFFCKYLDQSNLTNAYVSGLQTSLGWYGNQYTYAVALYTAGYAIMQVPSTLIVQKVRPSYWLGFCEVAWAALTFAQAGARNTETMYALRFFVAVFESAFFPVGMYLLGTWYTPNELAKRAAIFHLSSAGGTAFSGYMQAAVYTTLNGRGGLEGWQWLYIVCGIITFPCGVMVFVLLPDYLQQGHKRWYLTDAEFELAQERMAKVGRVSVTGRFSTAAFKRVLGRWHIYLMPLTYVCYGLGTASGGYMAIYLKSTGQFTVAQVNLIPTILNVIQAFGVALWAFLSDYTGSRYVWVAIPALLGIIPTAILTAWPSNSSGLILAAFLLCGLQFVTAIYFSWFQEICQNDPLERALVTSVPNGLQYASSAWVTILIFPQTDSPNFRKGFPATLGLNIASLFLASSIYLLHKRDLRRERINAVGGVGEFETHELVNGPQGHAEIMDTKPTLEDEGVRVKPALV